MAAIRNGCLISALALGLACGVGCSGPQTLAGRTLAEWEQQLSSSNRRERLAAIRAIGEMARLDPEGSGALPLVREAMDHEDSAVRYWAVRTVSQIGDAASTFTDALADALDDEATEVRILAAYALCRQGQTETGLPVLIDELKSTNGPARLHAAHALEALGEDARPAVEALQGVLGDEFGYPGRVAMRVLRSLGELPDETAGQ
jgi:HEAT repeat protein